MRDRYGNELVKGDYVEVTSATGDFIAIAVEDVNLTYGKRIKISILKRPNAFYFYSPHNLAKKEPEELI